MENLFGVQNMLSDLMVQLGGDGGNSISVEIRSSPNFLPGMMRVPPRRSAPPDYPFNDSLDSPMQIAREYDCCDTNVRWQQAATMWFQTAAAERASIYDWP